MFKTISLIGSTGSIGDSTLKIARHLGAHQIRVAALAAHSNIDLLEQQAYEFQPDLIAVYDKEKAGELQKRLPHISVVGGMEGVELVAAHAASDVVISAMAGTLGVIPTLAAIQAGKTIGLANKEALVSGGALVMNLAKAKGVAIIPIDSEHSALFQCLKGENKADVHRLILTASGGAFRDFTSEQLDAVTPQCALKHPTWNMGAKVTIDCSTLMNKGLEAIEAHWLFDIPMEQIEVVIHPQSIIHSMVEYIDNSMLAQMCLPNMMVPIQYAITYPERQVGCLPYYDFAKYGHLDFFAPDGERFRCLNLAFRAAKEGGSLAGYMNAANEILVKRFLAGQISWKEIASKLESLMDKHHNVAIETIDDVLQIDKLGREEASRI